MGADYPVLFFLFRRLPRKNSDATFGLKLQGTAAYAAYALRTLYNAAGAGRLGANFGAKKQRDSGRRFR